MESETNTKRTGLDVGPKAGNAELVTEDLLRLAWARGHRYVKEPDGRMLTLMIGNHPDGATAYRLHDIATGDEVDRVRAKSLWSSTREQADAFDWIGTTPDGELRHMDADGKEADEMGNEPKREMTLDEVVGKLPECHTARRELDQLRGVEKLETTKGETTFDGVTGAFTPAGHIRRERRAERVQVASRVMAALIPVYVKDENFEVEPPENVCIASVLFTDKLLAYIDETEPKPEDDDPLFIKKEGEPHPHKKPETSPGKQPVKVTMADFDWRNVQDLGETIARSINNLGDAVRARVGLDTDSHCPRCDRSTPCPRRTHGRKPLDTPPVSG